ncbi:hypothetical protein [Dietzia sp.]|uniref:hypothetical protein n=1 Tax=Dietzia sp. TaxID=1871616 RepID=UPI002FD90C95
MDSISAAVLNFDFAGPFKTSATLHEGQTPDYGFFEAVSGSVGYFAQDFVTSLQIPFY